jgi:hypothetical protein
LAGFFGAYAGNVAVTLTAGAAAWTGAVSLIGVDSARAAAALAGCEAGALALRSSAAALGFTAGLWFTAGLGLLAFAKASGAEILTGAAGASDAEGAGATATGIDAAGVARTNVRDATDSSAAGRSTREKTTAAPALAPTVPATSAMRSVRMKPGTGAR